MKTEVQFTDPSSYRVTLSVTATLAELETLVEQMQGAPYYGPAQTMRDQIREVATKVRGKVQVFGPEPDDG